MDEVASGAGYRDVSVWSLLEHHTTKLAAISEAKCFQLLVISSPIFLPFFVYTQTSCFFFVRDLCLSDESSSSCAYLLVVDSTTHFNDADSLKQLVEQNRQT